MELIYLTPRIVNSVSELHLAPGKFCSDMVYLLVRTGQQSDALCHNAQSTVYLYPSVKPLSGITELEIS